MSDHGGCEQETRRLDAVIDDLRAKLDKTLIELGEARGGTLWYARIHRAEERAVAAEASAGQLQVQLAGCLTAAEGHTSDPAKHGDYGWSLAYQRTLDLYARFERAQDQLSTMTQAVGLATTAVPTMVIDASDPIGMMHKVVDRVRELEADNRFLRSTNGDDITAERLALEDLVVLIALAMGWVHT